MGTVIGLLPAGHIRPPALRRTALHIRLKGANRDGLPKARRRQVARLRRDVVRLNTVVLIRGRRDPDTEIAERPPLTTALISDTSPVAGKDLTERRPR